IRDEVLPNLPRRVRASVCVEALPVAQSLEIDQAHGEEHARPIVVTSIQSLSFAQVCIAKSGIEQSGFAEIGLAQIGPSKVRPQKIGADELRIEEVRSDGLRLAKVRSTKVRPAEDRNAEVSVTQVWNNTDMLLPPPIPYINTLQ